LKYLLTGACGFIASRIAERLLSDGHEVIGVDNINDAYDVRLKNWRLNRLNKQAGFEFHKIDICDRAALKSLFASKNSIAAVINLGARAGVRQSVVDPWIYFDTNCVGTLNLLELCRSHRIQKFILASTSSLYGMHNPLPYSEDADTSRPLSPYAASKGGAEALCHSYHHLHGLDITILRYFTVYGPAGRPDMSLFRFVQWISEDRPVVIFGDGKQSRDFTYVDDVAAGTISALRPLGYVTINLGSDHPVPLMEVVHTVERLLGKTARLEYRPSHPADVPATWANITRAREHLGWSPVVSLDEGITRLVEWYRENREWARDINTD
jgi:nucleoside-diphosphate-sugar epimerase